MAIYNDTGSNLVKFNFNQNPLAKELTPSKEEIDMSIYGIPEMNGMDDFDLSLEKEYDVEAKESDAHLKMMGKLKQLHSEAKAKNINISNPGKDPNAQAFAKEWITAFYEEVNRGKSLTQSLKNREQYSKYAMMPNVIALPLPKGEIVTNDVVNASLLRYDPAPLQAIVNAYKTSESVYSFNDLEQLEADYDNAQKAIVQWVDTQPPQFREQLQSQVVIPYLGAMKSDKIDQYKREKMQLEKDKLDASIALKKQALAISQQNADASTLRANTVNGNNSVDNGYDALWNGLKNKEQGAVNTLKAIPFPRNQKGTDGTYTLKYILPVGASLDPDDNKITIEFAKGDPIVFTLGDDQYNGILKNAYSENLAKKGIPYVGNKQTNAQAPKPIVKPQAPTPTVKPKPIILKPTTTPKKPNKYDILLQLPTQK